MRRRTQVADVSIELEVNGTTRRATVPAHRILRDLLRDEFGLTGTKGACEDGMCGACTVHLDGEPVKSCLVLAATTTGHRVRTIEGLAEPDGRLHPVQQALLDEFGFQCGFCTPGFAMTIAAAVERRQDFDQDSAREELVGNICRCTGYTSIVDAFLRAQENPESSDG